jgi:hypothetical protein
MRVMGVELLDELRNELQSLEQRYRMDGRRPTCAVVSPGSDREQRPAQQHGYSRSMNEFSIGAIDPTSLSDAIERSRLKFADAAAGAEFRDCSRAGAHAQLEAFVAARWSLRGSEAADTDGAAIRERIEAMERLARDRQRQPPADRPRSSASSFPKRAALAGAAARPARVTRARRHLRGGDDAQLSPRAIRRIGAQALATIYGALRKVARAVTTRCARVSPSASRRDAPLAVRRRFRRRRREIAAQRGQEERHGDADLVVPGASRSGDASRPSAPPCCCSTRAGRCPGRTLPGGERAIALDHLIRARWPRDHFFVVGFSTRARGSRCAICEASWDTGDVHELQV